MSDDRLRKQVEASERLFCCALGGLLCIVIVLVRELFVALFGV